MQHLACIGPGFPRMPDKPDTLRACVLHGLEGKRLIGDVWQRKEQWQLSRDACTLQGVTELPSEEDMWAQVAKQHKFNRRSFTQVKRHALMVIACCSSSLALTHALCVIRI